MAMLRRVILNGFKSIKAMDLELRSLNVLIGANGAGKSNLVLFFKMLNEMIAGNLRIHFATVGRSAAVFFGGPTITQRIEATLQIDKAGWRHEYSMQLAHAAGDTLAFRDETMSFHEIGATGEPTSIALGKGHQESKVRDAERQQDPRAYVVRRWLANCRIFHFHDTSPTARVKQFGYAGDNHPLLSDAGNLAAFLLRLREENSTVYQRIVSTIRLIAPFFGDFDFEAPGTGPDVILNWRQKGMDQVFGPHQLSDGTLRFMALATLLLQPAEELPELIVVDEPELGLHPSALNLVASLLKMASHSTQVLVATQSVKLLDEFEPDQVIVVDREGAESKFRRLDAAKAEAWLEEYSLGEVWEKNVFGGGPH